MSLKFVNLHGHSGASIGDAIGSPEEHANWVLKNAGDDSRALAITDHGNLSNASYIVAAQKKLKDSVRIHFGTEAYFIPSIEEWTKIKRQREEEKKEQKEESSDELVIENEAESKTKHFDPINRRNHLVLVAQNQIGLKNLFRLVSRSYCRENAFYRKPRIDMDMLKECNEGLIASSACLASVANYISMQHQDQGDEEVYKAYDREFLPLMELFGKDRFYLELQFNNIPQQQVVNRHLVEYSKRTGYRLICTADSHYCSPDLFRDREIYRLLAYQMQKRQIDMSILEKSIDELDAQLYLKNGDQIFESYKKTFGKEFTDDQLIIDAIQRTWDISQNFIEDVSPDATIKLPKTFQVSDKIKTPFDQLKLYCLEGLKKKGLTSQKYIDRTAYELKIIKKLGFEEYFLTVQAILNELRKHMMLGTARGSAAGSMVDYLLDISLVDPIKNGLLFERFISLSRKELADIDSDIEDKEEAFKIIQERFGKENVLAISNYNRLQLKSLIKDISRLYGIEFQEVNHVTKIIEDEAKPKIMEEIGQDQKLYQLTFEKAKEHSPTFSKFLEDHPEIGKHIENLYQETKSCGRHAGGVCIVPNAEDHLPIIKIRGTMQSPITEGITAQHLKYFGLVKIDILGLTTLRVIRKCIEEILKTQGITNPTIGDIWGFYNKNLHPDVIDPEDPKIFDKVYHKGNFLGVFQFAEKGVQKFCKKAKPKSVKDIAVVTSIFRPGPLCLSKDTTITTSCNRTNMGRRIRKSIEQLYNKFYENNEEFRKMYPLRVISFDEENKTFVKSKIKNIFKSGTKQVYKIFFQETNKYHYKKIIDSSSYNYSNFNHVILATSEHQFFTSKGWKELKDIQVGDYLCFQKLHKYDDKDPMKKARKGKNIIGRKSFRDTCFRHYEYRCIFCNWSEASLDVNHIDGNRNVNNNFENLCYFCPNHHRMYSENKITKEEILNQRQKYELFYNNEVRYVRFCGKEFVKNEECYDIELEEPHHNFIAGGFIVHNCGGSDKKYLKFKKEKFEQEHPILQEVLEETRGNLVYQEQFLLLAHKLAGFTLEESDNLRKLLVKPATTLAEELKKQRIEAGERFKKGCIEKGLSEKRANKLWDEEISGWISYGFSKNHAVPYAFNSYQCAFLLTYHEKEWIKACLEFDPDLQETINNVRLLGYEIANPDINHSSLEWSVKDNTCFPSLVSLKGVGDVAARELVERREKNGGFKDINDFFFTPEGTYRWNKLNKKSLELLIKTGAFANLKCIGPGALFKSGKHFCDTLLTHLDKIRSKKISLEDAAKQTEVSDWTIKEIFEFQKSIVGFYDKVSYLKKYEKIFKEFEIKGIDEVEDNKDKTSVWAVIEDCEQKKTKTGKPYLVVKCSGRSEKMYDIKIWDQQKTKEWEIANVIVIDLEYSSFGYALPRSYDVTVL